MPGVIHAGENTVGGAGVVAVLEEVGVAFTGAVGGAAMVAAASHTPRRAPVIRWGWGRRPVGALTMPVVTP